jgi:hypothetical protein
MAVRQTVNDIFFAISTSITTRTFRTFSPSRRGWDAGSRCIQDLRPTPRRHRAMIEGMKMMTQWHTDSFNASPIGSYEVEVNEFVSATATESATTRMASSSAATPITHEGRASAYRLDWNGRRSSGRAMATRRARWNWPKA